MIHARTQFKAQSGFSLLEVLVAFAILALSLGVLMQIFSRGMLTTLAAAQYSRAASLAEARLAAVGSAIPLEAGATSGKPENGFAWELSIVQTELADAAPGLALSTQAPPVTPYRVTVTILWQDGARARHLTLSTLRLGEQQK
ncbi:MAG TPA: prepilin-type N-terminal cleavage/methylation domain-containing protein [Lamprocystis sp. (in: g-proteobacteria)]|nr:prepilin-type N-terminal cleavage/methylation domain-containing protein [Lamprocystis sp. (in: g-proteobacteria)]